jgi:hypothetical protein
MPRNCLYRLRPESRNICTKAPAASVGRSGATMDQIAVARGSGGEADKRWWRLNLRLV